MPDYTELNAILIKAGLNPIEPDDLDKLLDLVNEGWEKCWTEWFGQSFVDALAPHHKEAIEWHWDSRIALLKGEKPDYLAYFPIFSRGHMKSSIAERLVVADAMLASSHRKPGYALYVARNKDKVQEHIANIERLLSLEGVVKWNKRLSTPQRTEITNQQRKWTSSFLKTDVNYSIQGGTLDSGLAGSRVEETRPTAIFLDDLDGREDSPVIAESRLKQLTTEVLPMRQGDTLVFFAQNLISRFSTMYRIYKGQERVLTNRKPSEPIPAVYDLVTETRMVNGIVKDVFVSGTPSWHVWDVARIQDEIDTEGLQSFLRECQHQVDIDKLGNILYNYNDDIHTVSESEFEAKFGKNGWKYWKKKCGNDWARTKTDKHANVAGWLTVSDSFSALPNMTFFFPFSFPADSSAEDVAERLLSKLSPYAYDKVTWEQLRKDTVKRINAGQHTSTVSEQISYEHGELSQVIPKYSKRLLEEYNVIQGQMSHEQDAVRRIYNSVYGLSMKGVNPRKHGGIETVNRLMKVDYDEPHPFRDIQGYTRFFIVTPDDKDAVPRVENDHFIYPPKPLISVLRSHDLNDSDLARFQFQNWRYRPPKLTETGEIIDESEKMFDDFGNLLQMWFVNGEMIGGQLTTAQKIEMTIPNKVKDDLLTAKTGQERLSATLVYEFEKELAELTLNVQPEEDYEW